MRLIADCTRKWRRKWQPTPVFLPGESQGRGSLVGCCQWGRTESGTTEATQQQQQQVTYWRRQWQPTPVLLPEKSYGWRSLVGCSPWGHKESDTTERLSIEGLQINFLLSLYYIFQLFSKSLSCFLFMKNIIFESKLILCDHKDFGYNGTGAIKIRIQLQPCLSSVIRESLHRREFSI